MPSTLLESPAAAVIAKYEPVIGLEVHVQLGTRTKIFCGCPTEFGHAAQHQCLSGLPRPARRASGAEPGGRGTGDARRLWRSDCTINPVSRFARKNYFYPDLPKGYQISQYDEPLAEHG